MKHLTLPRFWKYYNYLPKEIQEIADKNYEFLKLNPKHPSLHLKKVGKQKQLWSVRVGDNYRALGVEKREGIVWFWIGTHEEYDKILKKET
jgi:mRNA-degrading endonuclease RelE of RelBE toxin-antitoxin system